MIGRCVLLLLISLTVECAFSVESRACAGCHREIYERWIEDGDCPCPEGESHNDVRRRLAEAFAQIDATRPIVVAHGTV